MNARLLTFMVVFIFQNQVLAAEEQKAARPIEAVCEGSSGDYSEFNFVSILVDAPSNFDRNKAFLFVDKNGRPAVYPLFKRDHRCIMLGRHSLTDILGHWTPTKVEAEVYSFSFFYWANGSWRPARVELQFRDNLCSRFRVVTDDTSMQSWLPTGAIPVEGDRPSAIGKLKLPFEIGIVEGPRDTSDCSIRPIPEHYLKALAKGKCPLGLGTRTSSDEGL